MTVLAADVGGTNTRLALFERATRSPIHLETYASKDHAGLDEMIRLFLSEHPVPIDAA
ncbi:MAG: Glucokinase, partial [Actinomycetota bacterium]|nr:Glucokinase [Actinomycetota bacterium]